MNEIWPKVRLGDVCKITAGNSAPQDKALFQGGKYPFIRTSDVGEIHFGVIENSRDKLNDVGIRGLRLFPKGSILFPKSGASTYLNHRVLLGVDAYVVSHLAVIMPSEKVYPEFLLHALSLVDAKSLMQDNSYPSLRADEIGAAEIPLPPLAEQRKIVEKVEKALKRVDALKAQFERMEKSAADYFKAALAETFAAVKGEKVKLGDVCENCDSRRIPITKADRRAGAFPYYGASGVVDHVDQYIFDGDFLLVSEDGANLLARSTPIAFSVSGKIWVNNHAHVLRFKSMYTQRYVEYFFASIDIADRVTGAAQPKLTQNALNAISLPYPSLEVQREVVKRLAEMKDTASRLEAAARRGIAICGKMRKAILAEAFQ